MAQYWDEVAKRLGWLLTSVLLFFVAMFLGLRFFDTAPIRAAKHEITGLTPWNVVGITYDDIDFQRSTINIVPRSKRGFLSPNFEVTVPQFWEDFQKNINSFKSYAIAYLPSISDTYYWQTELQELPITSVNDKHLAFIYEKQDKVLWIIKDYISCLEDFLSRIKFFALDKPLDTIDAYSVLHLMDSINIKLATQVNSIEYTKKKHGSEWVRILVTLNILELEQANETISDKNFGCTPRKTHDEKLTMALKATSNNTIYTQSFRNTLKNIKAANFHNEFDGFNKIFEAKIAKIVPNYDAKIFGISGFSIQVLLSLAAWLNLVLYGFGIFFLNSLRHKLNDCTEFHSRECGLASDLFFPPHRKRVSLVYAAYTAGIYLLPLLLILIQLYIQYRYHNAILGIPSSRYLTQGQHEALEQIKSILGLNSSHGFAICFSLLLYFKFLWDALKTIRLGIEKNTDD
jgi:hypothetical protein